MSYKKVMSTLSKIENIENIKKIDVKPRLLVFSSIAKCEEASQSTLFEDIKNLVTDPLYKESKCITNVGCEENTEIEAELTAAEQEEIYQALGL